jgi:hypothetical protein
MAGERKNFGSYYVRFLHALDILQAVCSSLSFQLENYGIFHSHRLRLGYQPEAAHSFALSVTGGIIRPN